MALRKSNSGEGSIYHYGSVRLRALGSGNLRMRLISLSDTKEAIMAPLVLSTATDREPLKTVNFKQQRASLEISTTAIDEYFSIDKIVVYIKPVGSSYPG